MRFVDVSVEDVVVVEGKTSAVQLAGYGLICGRYVANIVGQDRLSEVRRYLAVWILEGARVASCQQVRLDDGMLPIYQARDFTGLSVDVYVARSRVWMAQRWQIEWMCRVFVE